ncbi:hypothetical protein BH24ACT21_BH24ACT21_07690 [soil metagenome]
MRSFAVALTLGVMDFLQIIVVVILVLVLVGSFWLLARHFGKTKHRITGPELRNRATRESERLAELVEEREANRPSDDPVIQDHELVDRRVTYHDEETQEIYHRDYLPEVAELREHFAERGIRNGTLDGVYESAENDADLRTISTALEEMAARLK